MVDANDVKRGLTDEFAEEFLLVHAVLEGFAAVNEDYRNFVGVEAADFGIGVHVDFPPGEAAPLMQLDEALLHDLAEMASLPGIDDNFTGLRHRKKV